MKRWLNIVPAPVLLLSLAMASTQPLIGLWLAGAPPPGYVATGLHIPDSALFLQSMRMFFNGFESQYVTCQSPAISGIQFYPLPHLWLYGVVGALARALGLSDFAMYFIANGVGAFVYLLAVYFFLREVARKNWRLPFALFCLSGGLGGVLYLSTRLLGLQSSPAFADYFRRFALYELFEGAHLQPVLCFPRLYYTLSLALCLGALTLLIRGHRQNNRRALTLAGLLFLPGMFIDMRYGAFTLALAFLYLWQEKIPGRSLNNAFSVAWLVVPGFAGAAAGWLLLRTNPAAIQNHIDVANTAMWLTPFLSVAALHLLVAPREVFHRAARLPLLEKTLAFGAIGYLAAFAVLFAAYQIYWGNVLVARDAAAALAVSDWAFIGAAAGIAWSILQLRVQARRPHHNTAQPDWIVLWLLSFLVMSITAFGGGWWLKFGPQRFQIFLWLPLCIVSANAIEQLRAQQPARARAVTAALIVCGVCSLVAAVLFFQGPLAFQLQAAESARPPYAGYHAEVMTTNDAAAIGAIGDGIVLAPNLAADAVALNRPNRVVWGTGSFNMSDQPYAAMESEVARFFGPDAPAEWRLEFIQKWCVAWVYCPETWPVSTAAIEQIRALPCLEETARHGNAVVFRVIAHPRAI
ncbi:MAG: hypothetical protein NTZ09_06960 [Candidatus Hydrogenedentes bacterium]|nr:hypothetical protein [Candidatus Hydrogenedentota bacterium]